MANQITGHLEEEQIIEALIDEAGLDPTARRHLLECPACRAEKETLEGKLAQFGRLSRDNAPPARRLPRLSERTRSTGFAWRIRPSFGMGIAFASLLALLLNPHFFKPGKDTALEKVYQEMLQDEKFMTEIERLEENPLPRFFVDITDFSDPDEPDEPRDSKLPGGRDEIIT